MFDLLKFSGLSRVNPNEFVLHCCNKLKTNNNIAKLSFAICNDSMISQSIILMYNSHSIAAACIYIASKLIDQMNIQNIFNQKSLNDSNTINTINTINTTLTTTTKTPNLNTDSVSNEILMHTSNNNDQDTIITMSPNTKQNTQTTQTTHTHHKSNRGVSPSLEI